MYRVVVVQKDGTEIGEIINFTKLNFEKRLNNYGQCTIDIPLAEPQLESLISPRNFEVRIYRDETLVWAGEQVDLSGTLDGQDDIITLTCFDYLEMLNSRYTEAVQEYAAVDAGQIAWDLIEVSQAKTYGNFYIEEGTIEATQDRDRSYYTDNIMESIINLSQVINGFDFEITDLKVFNVYAKKGFDRSATDFFEYGVNILAPNINYGFSKAANSVISMGEGFADNQLREIVTNTTLASAYYLREAKLIDTDVSEPSTLIEKGEEYIRKYGQPLLNVTFKQVPNTIPTFGTLGLGDSVKLNIRKGIFNINNTFRIYEMRVDVDQHGVESIEYVVSLFT